MRISRALAINLSIDIAYISRYWFLLGKTEAFPGKIVNFYVTFFI